MDLIEFTGECFGFFVVGVVIDVICGILQDCNFVFRPSGDFIDFPKSRIGAFNVDELLLPSFVFCVSYL